LAGDHLFCAQALGQQRLAKNPRQDAATEARCHYFSIGLCDENVASGRNWPFINYII
jgi:hypothetical protein